MERSLNDQKAVAYRSMASLVENGDLDMYDILRVAQLCVSDGELKRGFHEIGIHIAAGAMYFQGMKCANERASGVFDDSEVEVVERWEGLGKLVEAMRDLSKKLSSS